MPVNGAEILDRQVDGGFDERLDDRHDPPGKQRTEFDRIAALDLDLAEGPCGGTVAAREDRGYRCSSDGKRVMHGRFLPRSSARVFQ